jgi:TATA-box binding protein (TBP) (component of TFIID and TFIIIB)
MSTYLQLPEVYNVKFHFPIENKIVIPPHIECKKCNNFIVSRNGKLVFSIFNSMKKKGFVNVTGCKNFEEIKKAVSLFTETFNVNVDENKIVVDNSTASGRAKSPRQRISLSKIKVIIDSEDRLQPFSSSRVRLHPHYFPGAVFRRIGKPTIIIFSSGSYVIVGGKTINQITESYQTLCAIINKSLTTNIQIQECA